MQSLKHGNPQSILYPSLLLRQKSFQHLNLQPKNYIQKDKLCSMPQNYLSRHLFAEHNLSPSNHGIGTRNQVTLRKSKHLQSRRKQRPKLGGWNLSAEIKRRKKKSRRERNSEKLWRRRGQVGRMDRGNWVRRAKCYWSECRGWSASEDVFQTFIYDNLMRPLSDKTCGRVRENRIPSAGQAHAWL